MRVERLYVALLFAVLLDFFHARTTLQREDSSWNAIIISLVFLALAVPVRIATVMLHRHASLSEAWASVVARKRPHGPHAGLHARHRRHPA